MENLTDIGTVKKILNKWGFKFSKSLGQNFLINKDICPKMAQACGIYENMGVIEVGPGIGTLTLELAKKSKKVVAIELDKRLIPILNETTAEFDNIKIINEDILQTDLKLLIEEEFRGFDKIVVCANLPYYITSPVIMKVLESGANIDSMILMVQKEAAERICAKLGTRESGAISVAVRFYSDPEILFPVSRGNFIPSPNVDSAVMNLNIHRKGEEKVKNKKMFFRIIRAAFKQRRKTILNSLSAGLCIAKDEILVKLVDSGIDSKIRPERLDLDDFIKLSKEF